MNPGPSHGAEKLLHPLLFRARALLLDFDGPICRVFASLDRNALMADLVRGVAAHGTRLPDSIVSSGDPMAALAWSGDGPPSLRHVVDDVVRRYELAGAIAAEPTPGLFELLDAARQHGSAVAVVTNNSADAVTAFARRRVPDLTTAPVIGRPRGRPDEMKPSPKLLLRALAVLSVLPADAVMIGDSVTDVVAGRAAGVRVVGLARSVHKHDLLAAERPDLLVSDLHALVVD